MEQEKKERQELFPLPKETTEESIVPYDPLQRYLQEIRKVPLLTEEEEKELAVESGG